MNATAPNRPWGGSAPSAAVFSAVLLFCWLLTAGLLSHAFGDHPRLVLIATQVLGLLLPALALTRAFAALGLPPRTSRRAPPSKAALCLAVPGLLISGFLLGLSINHVWLRALHATGWAWVGELEALVNERYRELLTSTGFAELLLVLVMVSLVPAVCEELAFRRGLQGLLASKGSATAAVLGSAAVFSAFHLEPFGLPTRFFLGISLGIAYHRTGKLWVPGLLHGLHNLATVGGLKLAERSGVTELPSLEGLAKVPAGALATLGALGLCGWLLSLGLLRPAKDGEKP